MLRDGVAPAILQRNGDGDGGPADALHRCRHGERGTTAACCGMTAGTTSLQRFCSGKATGTAAPRGPNYSVTAGEHGEPADEEPHIYMYGPKGGEQA